MSDLLLKSVDVMRAMLRAVQAKQPIDAQRVSDLQFDLELMIAQKNARRPPTPPLPRRAAAGAGTPQRLQPAPPRRADARQPRPHRAGKSPSAPTASCSPAATTRCA